MQAEEASNIGRVANEEHRNEDQQQAQRSTLSTPPSDELKRWWKVGGHKEGPNERDNVKLMIDNYTRDANELSTISKPIVISAEVSEHERNVRDCIMTRVEARVADIEAPSGSRPSGATPVVAGSSVSTQTPIRSDTNGSSSTQTQNQTQNQQPANQWMLVASQTTQEMRHRMSLASDQLGYSLRQLYASASSITGDSVPPSYHNIPGIVPYYHGRSSGPPPSYDDVVNPYAAPPTYQSLFGQMLEARKTSRGLVELLRRLLIISTLGCTMLIALMILIPFTMIIVGAIYIEDCNIEHIPAFLLVGGVVWASKNIIHCYAQCAAQEGPSEPIVEFGTNRFSEVPASASTSLDPQSHTGGHENTSENTSTANPGEYQTAQFNQPIQQQQQLYQHRRERRFKSSVCESLLNCVLFGWFIAGCVIVFKNYEPDFENTSSPRYCHRTVYMYTFWLITSAIMMFGLFITCICCLMVSSAVATREHDDIS